MKYSQFIFVLMLSTALGLANAYAGTAGEAGAADACGTGCSYTISEDGKTMTVTGTGENATVNEKAFSRQYDSSGSWISKGSYDTRFDNIENIVVTGTLSSIGSEAFSGNNLTSVTIHNSVTSIGWRAFSNNDLTSVTIPDSVTSIGGEAFISNDLTSVTIPDSVTSIGSNAFNGNNLTSVTIPDSVTSIESYAFCKNNLTSIVIPDSVTSIGDGAFKDNNLTSVTIPNSVTSIGSGAFYNTNITTLDLPDSLVNIDPHAFSGMNSLQSLTISENFQGNLTDLVDGGAYKEALSNLASAQRMLERAEENGYSESMLTRYQERVARYESEVEQARANLLNNTDLFSINCKGDVEVCKANLLTSLSAEYREVLGTKVPFKISEATYEEPDGHGGYAIKTYGGKLLGFKNKRIYTIDEANAVAKPTGNTVRIKYR